MIARYKDFIIENTSVVNDITTEEKELLEIYNIKNYKFNKETNLIDVYQDVILPTMRLDELPNIRFGKIYGNFNCKSNNISSLKNAPKIVMGYFSCTKNNLTSLEYCPDYVGNDFFCRYNKITYLEYYPKFVGKNFEFEYNNYILKNIEDYPLWIVKRDIYGLLTETEISIDIINKIVKENEEIFKNLLDDKIKFHQMIMRLNPDLIKYYKTIPPPKNNTKLLI